MNDDHPSTPVTRARSPRTVVLLGFVLASLVGCSTGTGAGQDSVVALEEARAEAAAELAEVQEALDRQVEAADAQKAEAQAAAEQAPKPAAAAAATKPAADRAAAPKAAPAAVTSRPAAARRTAAATRVTAPRAAAVTRVTAPRAAAVTRPAERTTGTSPQPAPARSGAGKRATAPVAPPKPVAARPPRAAAAPKPPSPKAAAATTPTTTPTTTPQDAVSSTDDLSIVVAPGGTSSAPGDPSAVAVCEPRDFQTGDRVLLTTDAGQLVREAVLPACQPEVLAGPGTGTAPSSPGFSVTLPEIAWRDGDAWILTIGSRHWPVTASTLSEHGWSIAVTAEGGVAAGPVERHCGGQQLPEPPAWVITLAEDASATPSTAPASTGSPSCSAGSSPVSAGAAATAQ